jgi:hypothetical protein
MKRILCLLASTLMFAGCTVTGSISPNTNPTPSASPSTSNGTGVNLGTNVDSNLNLSDIFKVNPVTGTVLLSASANLARQPGVIVTTSSEYAGWPKERINDGDLNTSWFAAVGDSSTQNKQPFVNYQFPRPIRVTAVNIWGNREYDDGYDVLEANLVVGTSDGRSQTLNLSFPSPNRDFNVNFSQPIANVTSLRLTVLRDEKDPGIAEIEVAGSVQ